MANSNSNRSVVKLNDGREVLLLQAFRSIAEAMQTEPTDWQWIGHHMSQRMFGITETRAKAYAARHGGTAQPMFPCGQTEAIHMAGECDCDEHQEI